MKIDINGNSNYLWRIIFTILITLLHSNYIEKDMANIGWYLAVDYFFIISGFWVINSCERKEEVTSVYMLKRISKLYPHQLFSFIVIFTWFFLRQGKTELGGELLKHLGEALPFTYFIFDSGYAGNYPFNFSVWYLSVLLLSSLVIYYFVQRHKELFCVVIAPCIIIFGYSYLYKNCISLNTGSSIGFFFNEYYLRGFTDMSLGVMLYCIIKRLNRYVPTRLFYIIAHILEFICLGGVIIFTYNHSDKSDIWMVFIIASGVVCSFLYPKETIINSKYMGKLNELMYPVYLNHIMVINVLEYVGVNGASVKNALIYILVLFVYSCLTNYIVKKCIHIMELSKKFLLN